MSLLREKRRCSLESLPIRRLSNPYLKECLVVELCNLEKLLVEMPSRKPHFATGDFNAKYTNWSIKDTITSVGAQFDSDMTVCGLKQLITVLTHILQHFSSYIDNILMDSRIHSTLPSKCHHQIIYSKNQLRNWISSFIYLWKLGL